MSDPHLIDAEMAKSCGCIDCLRFLASIDDGEYTAALRDAFRDVLGEDP